MNTIRIGSKGAWVEKWQLFLRGLGLYLSVVDGDFGPNTAAATRRFQALSGLEADGVVGNMTFGKAMCMGFTLVSNDTKDTGGPNWPPQPKIKIASKAIRESLFGKFEYTPAPTKNNPEGIKILGTWTKDNITKVTIPQLKGVVGAPASGTIYFHKNAARQAAMLFQAWEDAGLQSKLLTWAGSWAPRFIRGSQTHLSNHSWATAFDINAAWNGLGRQPALAGQRGSVRELVTIAADFGFFWGGYFSRQDGMHFECAKII